jgi:hypothetical protein
MLKAILRAPINGIHLLVVSVVSILLTYFIMNDVILFLIWGFVGDGVYPKWWDFWINATYLLSAIIFLYPVILFLMSRNCKKGKWSEAKSYLIASIVILVCSGIISYRKLH